MLNTQYCIIYTLEYNIYNIGILIKLKLYIAGMLV